MPYHIPFGKPCSLLIGKQLSIGVTNVKLLGQIPLGVTPLVKPIRLTKQ